LVPILCKPSLLLALGGLGLVHLHLGLKISHFGSTPRNTYNHRHHIARGAVRKDGNGEDFLQRAALAGAASLFGRAGTMEPVNRCP
jgi:hypothetical protein